MRIDKLLSNKGMGSRNDVKKLIKKGKVKINSQLISKADVQVKETDIVEFEELTISTALKHYFVINKPKGYVCALKDNVHKCINELFPNIKNLVPVGRLDLDTTGTLLLTDDGKWAHQIINGKGNVAKTYLVTLEHPITDGDVDKLKLPIDLGDFITKPAKVTKINKTQLHITITEGKHHQVKRMIHSVGNEVIELHRISVGNYNVDGLKPGEYKEIEPGILI